MQKLSLLGRGGTSEVWLLIDPVTNKQYAGKYARAQTNAILKHEAEVLKQLHHSGIPRYHGTYVMENKMTLCMEYISGDTLRDYLIENGACTHAMTIGIAYKLLDILSYLHHCHIIHGDLKLQNVMLSNRQHIYVLDYGSTRMQGETLMEVYGTIGYAAPEQIKYGICSEQTDIYAFGKILYALLSGIYDVEQLYDAHWHTLSYPWCFLLDMCLAENPAYRFQQVEDIQACLSLFFWQMPSKHLYLFTSVCLLLVWMGQTL